MAATASLGNVMVNDEELASVRKGKPMGMDLTGRQGYFRVGGGTWGDWLKAAKECGWEPAGTEKPDFRRCMDDPCLCREAEWGGWYNSNDHQRVTAEDAKALSQALAHAIQKEKLPSDEDYHLWAFIGYAAQGGFCIG